MKGLEIPAIPRQARTDFLICAPSSALRRGQDAAQTTLPRNSVIPADLGTGRADLEARHWSSTWPQTNRGSCTAANVELPRR